MAIKSLYEVIEELMNKEFEPLPTNTVSGEDFDGWLCNRRRLLIENDQYYKFNYSWKKLLSLYNRVEKTRVKKKIKKRILKVERKMQEIQDSYIKINKKKYCEKVKRRLCQRKEDRINDSL